VITAFLRRLPRAIRRHGIVGAFKVATGQVRELAATLQPSVRAKIRERKQRADDFDRRFNVDTGGCIHPTKLVLQSLNQVHAVSYGGSDPEDFRAALATLPIDYQRFAFVDFGSGKGRAILLATEFPFQRIIGVEFSEELHKIAQDNINRFQSNSRRCDNVESVCMDVLEYSLPDKPLLCYFCNPFDAKLMTQVISNIRESFLRTPREIFIVYYNPKEAYLFDRADWLQQVGKSGSVQIWRTVLQPAIACAD
jgi:SAM-dependent methyltransferase